MIRILVDSASDCGKDNTIIDYYMPITVNLNGQEYRDGIDITKDEFYELLTNTEEFPHTSQPSPQAFEELFEKVKADGDELIYFALSSALSGTYQGAMIAKEMAEFEGVRIVDTRGATHMIAMLVEYARKLIDAGETLDEIADKCEALKGRIKVIAGVDTLEYLYRGGRLSRTSAAIGSLAGIKPVLAVTPEGTVEAIGKCLGKGRAIQFILDKVAAYQVDETFPMYSLFTYGEENCADLETKLKAAGYAIAQRRQIGPSIGTHTGPGVYAVLFVVK